MIEFKSGDYVVLVGAGTKDLLLQIIDHKYTDDLYRVKILSTGQCGPVFKSQIQLASKEEIAAGHRIDCETLDKPENHLSPLCKVEDV